MKVLQNRMEKNGVTEQDGMAGGDNEIDTNVQRAAKSKRLLWYLLQMANMWEYVNVHVCPKSLFCNFEL